MDLSYPPEAEAFRAEIRAWLEVNLPEGWGTPGFHQSPEAREAWLAEWNEKLFEGGWICASWPEEYGGRALSLMQSVVLNEEFARAGAPLRADFFGDTLVGPTIVQWGTEDQKRHFLPGIMRGETCQGFSEPLLQDLIRADLRPVLLFVGASGRTVPPQRCRGVGPT